jgi:hypothetical protein
MTNALDQKRKEKRRHITIRQVTTVSIELNMVSIVSSFPYLNAVFFGSSYLAYIQFFSACSFTRYKLHSTNWDALYEHSASIFARFCFVYVLSMV